MSQREVDQVTPSEAAARCELGSVLLDVREPGEWAAGHAPQAVHAPLADVIAAPDRFADRADVLTVCRGGVRSAQAAAALASAGVSVRNVEGGMAAWAASGLPVVRDDGGPGEVA